MSFFLVGLFLLLAASVLSNLDFLVSEPIELICKKNKTKDPEALK